MVNEFMEQLKNASLISTPIVGIETQDANETVASIVEVFVAQWQEWVKRDPKIPVPLFMKWDVMDGLVAVQADGTVGPYSEAALQSMFKGRVDPEKPLAPQIEKLTTKPTDMLKIAKRIPAGTMTFYLNFQRVIEDFTVAQGLNNLRDANKQNRRMAILLAPMLKLPPQLQHDVLMLSEPLPDRPIRARIILGGLDAFTAGLTKAGKPPLTTPEPAVLERVNDITASLSAFAVDQAVSMNLSPQGFNINRLWDQKCKFIENTPGVRVDNSTETFDDLKGMDQIQRFGMRLLKGKDPFRMVVIFDESEKTNNAGTSDTSGVSQELNGAQLTWQQERNIPGMILLGPGGSGKTAFGKALGNMAPGGKVITLFVSIAEMKSSFVGSSMANFKQFQRMVDAASDGNALFIHTANKFDFSPEFQRRQWLGKWFFDIPGPEELALIWPIYIKKFGLNPKQKLPDSTGWTGAEVKACATLADKLQSPLIECANFIVPIAVSARDKIDQLRRDSSGKFLSAAKPGAYEYNEEIKVFIRGSREIVNPPSRGNALDN